MDTLPPESLQGEVTWFLNCMGAKLPRQRQSNPTHLEACTLPGVPGVGTYLPLGTCLKHDKYELLSAGLQHAVAWRQSVYCPGSLMQHYMGLTAFIFMSSLAQVLDWVTLVKTHAHGLSICK